MADIVMPQLGESVTEGTITKWFKQVGDHVAEDETLFEVSTDKVDSEVPSPSAGYITEIKVPEGEKPALGPRQIKALEAEIVRADPKPALKPVSKIKNPWQPPEQAAADEAFPELA